MPLVYDPTTDATYNVGADPLTGEQFRVRVASGDQTINRNVSSSSNSSTSQNLTKTVEKVGTSFFVFDPVTGQFSPTGVSDPTGTKQVVNTAQGAMIVDLATGQSQVIPGTTPTLSPDTAAQVEASQGNAQLGAATSLANMQAQLAAQAQEGNLTRQQQAQLKAIDNALSASQFASTYGLSVAQQKQQQLKDALAAANQFAGLISTTDTAALPAFYRAGGGVIANALAGGNTALSDNALLPAARTLRALATPVEAPPAFDPTRYQPSAFMANVPTAPVASAGPIGQYLAQIQAAAPAVVKSASPPPASAPTPTYETTPESLRAGGVPERFIPGTAAYNAERAVQLTVATPAAPAVADTSSGPGATWQPGPDTGPGFAYGTSGRPIMRYADGSVPAGMHTQFMAGDSTSADPAAGGAHPENVEINDPTGDATFKVDPLTPPGTGDTDEGGSVGSLLTAIGAFISAHEGTGPIMGPMAGMMPRHAYGTMPRYALGSDPSGIAPEDLPFLDQVRQLRQGVDTTAPIEGGYFNVGFRSLAPSLQSAYANSLQTRYGIPVGDINAEASRFALAGADRSTFGAGLGGAAKQDV